MCVLFKSSLKRKMQGVKLTGAGRTAEYILKKYALYKTVPLSFVYMELHIGASNKNKKLIKEILEVERLPTDLDIKTFAQLIEVMI